MAGKISQYTPKSTDFNDNDLFDVSKAIDQTSGVLIVGNYYTIVTFEAGDDFSNIASVISGTINTTGCVFMATGTTPTTYSNGSLLRRYETQSYTYSEIKTEFGLNGVFEVSGTLTAAQINALDSTPLELIPAQGVDKAIIIESFLIHIKDGFGYITSDDIVIGYNNGTDPVADFIPFGMINSGTNQLFQNNELFVGGSVPTSQANNKNIGVNIGGLISGGTQDVDYWIKYKVIDL